MKALLLVSVLVWIGLAGMSRAFGADAPGVAQSDAELIDRLVDVTDREFSVRTNVIGVGPGTRMPRGTRMMQDPDPFPSPAMSELARRGVKALPELVAHLDDSRRTKVTVKAMASGIRYSAEYDWNPHTAKVRPAGTVDVMARGPRLGAKPVITGDTDSRSYDVRVGDLCFNVIGQIVNRQFQAVRYQPTAIIVVNSPVLCPDLLNAVRNEWGRVTAEQLRESLVGDVTSPASSGQVRGALAILSRGDPGALLRAVQDRLKIPMYDGTRVRLLAMTQLYVEPDPDKRVKLVTRFVEGYGAAYRDGLLLQLWQDRRHKPGDKLVGGPGSDAIPRPTVAPLEVLKQFAPDFDDERPPVVRAVDGRDTAGFITEIGKLHRPELDDLIFEEYQVRSRSRAHSFGTDTDGVALSCIRELQHRNHDYQFLEYLRRRLGDMPDPWPDELGPDARRSFQSFIDALGKDER